MPLNQTTGIEKVARQVAEHQRDLRLRVDYLFRLEICRRTDRFPPSDFYVDNLDDQVRVVREMYGDGAKDTLLDERRALSTLVTKLVTKAMAKAVDQSIRDVGTINPEKWGDPSA